MAKKRRKKPLLVKLRKKATRVFNQYIREKAKIEESNLCPICRVNPIQVAFHIVSAKRKATCYDELNVVGACVPCNYQENYYSDISRAWYIRKFGVEMYLSIVDKSRQDFEYTVEYLTNIIDTYQQKLQQL